MDLKLFEANWNSCLTITDIKHNRLISLGIKDVLLDVDGTLLPRRENILHESVESWINEAKKYFIVHLISNNPSHKRIASIAKNLNITFTYKAAKPSKKSIEDYLHVNCSDRKKVALIGDRILTDIIAGNRCGVYTILVQAIRKDGKPQKKNIMLNIEKTIVKALQVIS